LNIYLLITSWFCGAAIAGMALLIPVYNYYVFVGTIGWLIVCICSGLIFYEIKRIRTEDRKKELV
jgi:FtsH-binding integral membrane protein